MRSGNLTRTTGRLGALLAFALLGACQSIDSLESLLDSDSRSAPPPQVAATAENASPQVREQAPAGASPPAATQDAQQQAQRGNGGPIRLQQPAPAPGADTQEQQIAAAAAPQTAAQAPAGEDAQRGNAETASTIADGEAGAEVSTGEAGDDESGRRVVEAPKADGLGGEITRRFNSLFGSSTSVRQPDQLVKASDVAGTWVLEEEDGLRTCAVTLSESGNQVQPAQGCSGLATRAARWSIFGSDLLLSTADNTVVARLRRSGDSWIGFTLETGIPLVLSRQATSQG